MMQQQQPAGITAALPQQGMAPGQAPQGLPFNVPQSGGGPGISPVTPNLKGMKAAELLQLLNQVRQSRDPKIAGMELPVAAALSSAVKAEQVAQAQASQAVMQQNAQQQQQPPVVQQIEAQAQQMQGPQQGIAQLMQQAPQRMAMGGVVQRFADGTGAEGLQMDPMGSVYGSEAGEYPETEAETIAKILAKNPEDRSPSENLKLFLARKNEPGKPQARLPSTPTTPTAPAPNVPQAAPTGIATPRQTPRQSPMAQIAPAVQPVPGPMYSDTGGLAELIENQKNELLKRKQTPEDVLAGRKGLDELMRKRIADEEAYAKTFGEEARTERDAALRESQGFNPRLLAAIGKNISTEKGKVFSSLLGGMSEGLEQQAKDIKAAKATYKQDQRLEQQMRSAVGQMQVLEAQRQQAIREKDYERASEIDDKISQLGIKLEEVKYTRSVQAEGQQLKREEAARAAAKSPYEIDLLKAQAQQARQYGAAAGAKAEGGGEAALNRAIRADPLLPELAKKAAFDPEAKAEYERRMRDLTLRYAPELLIGVGGASGAGSSTRSAADKIIGGG